MTSVDMPYHKSRDQRRNHDHTLLRRERAEIIERLRAIEAALLTVPCPRPANGQRTMARAR